MPMTAQQVEAEAMKLSPDERADLAEKLWLSVNSQQEINAAWEVEIERRIRQMDAGEVDMIPMEEVIANLRAKLG